MVKIWPVTTACLDIWYLNQEDKVEWDCFVDMIKIAMWFFQLLLCWKIMENFTMCTAIIIKSAFSLNQIHRALVYRRPGEILIRFENLFMLHILYTNWSSCDVLVRNTWNNSKITIVIGEDKTLLISFCSFLQTVPFYIFCESYGGKMVAAFSMELRQVMAYIELQVMVSVIEITIISSFKEASSVNL